MRKILAIAIMASATLASAPAVLACDMEGFGFARINPFGQHAAWNVPKDPPSPQQSENTSLLSAEARDKTDRSAAQDEATRASPAQPSANAAPKALTVSHVMPAEQTRRLSAIRD